MTSRQVGEIYSSKHSEYYEATQYCRYNSMHDLALFWSRPTLKEINGFSSQPVELALHVEHSALCLLYRIAVFLNNRQYRVTAGSKFQTSCSARIWHRLLPNFSTL